MRTEELYFILRCFTAVSVLKVKTGSVTELLSSGCLALIQRCLSKSCFLVLEDFKIMSTALDPRVRLCRLVGSRQEVSFLQVLAYGNFSHSPCAKRCPCRHYSSSIEVQFALSRLCFQPPVLTPAVNDLLV